MNIGLLLFPRLTLLDLVGPLEVFTRVPGVKVHLVWKTLEPVASAQGFAMLPTITFAACPPLDLICVPGGPGESEVGEDAETLDFLRKQARSVKWITSVCTGSLILGAAGLLQGYRAGCHWASLDQLALFGAEPVDERVVFDRNRVTGGGVTAGIDFALSLVATLYDADMAQRIQLVMEYDPAPPFPGGSPRTASPALVADMKEKMAGFLNERHLAHERSAARLRG